MAAYICLLRICCLAAVVLLFYGNGFTCYSIVMCLPGNTTNNLRVLDLILDLLGIRQAELQLIITLLILL
jgi:hypothetical protein